MRIAFMQAVYPRPGKRCKRQDLAKRAKRIDSKRYPLSVVAGEHAFLDFGPSYEQGLRLIIRGLQRLESDFVPTRLESTGLAAPAPRRQFAYECGGANLPAGRRRYLTPLTATMHATTVPIARIVVRYRDLSFDSHCRE